MYRCIIGIPAHETKYDCIYNINESININSNMYILHKERMFTQSIS
jgi:hypothetical protein